jgi:hypothetical protein
MRILEKVARFIAIVLAVLFICVSLFGIFGVWFVSRATSDIASKGFGVIEKGVGVVDAGVGRVDELIATSRTEVKQAAETINTVGAQAAANSPVLTALNERLETRLSPRIAQMRATLGPVRDAVANVSNAVDFLSTLPGMAERAPRLVALDETFDGLDAMSADTTQLRGTLRAMVEQKNAVSSETVAALKGLAQRIDTRLGEVQTNVQSLRSDIDALQARLDKRKSRLLFIFNLTAALLALMLAWIVYTQVVITQHHWTRLQRPVA